MVSNRIFVVSLVIAVILSSGITSAYFMSISTPPTPVAQQVPIIQVTRYVGGLTPDEAPLYAAQYEGFFLQNHIVITQIALGGLVASLQAVANDHSGTAFTISDLLDLTVLTSRNSTLPTLIQTANTAKSNPLGVLSLGSSKISKPTDLVGKTIGVPFGSAGYAALGPFLTLNGVKQSDVKILNVDFSGLGPGLLSHQLDAIVEFASNIGSLQAPAQSQGNSVTVMLFSDWGIPPNGNGVVMQKQLLTTNPTLAAEITNASLWGYSFCVLHPEKCIQDFVTLNPGFNYTSTLDDWNLFVTYGIGVDASKMSTLTPAQFGWNDPSTVAKIVTMATQIFSLTTTVDPNSIYTNQFVSPPPVVTTS